MAKKQSSKAVVTVIPFDGTPNEQLEGVRTIVVPRTDDRKNYAKFEVPFQSGQLSAIVYVPHVDAPAGTTVTITVTRGK